MSQAIRDCFTRDPWPHQLEAATRVIDELQTYNAVTLCSATGAGKSDVMWAMVQYYRNAGAKVLILTNRRMLTRQTMVNAQAKGIGFGVRAATLAEHFDASQDVQISSVQTEIARTINTSRWDRFPADIVLVDEGHLQATGESEKFLRSYLHDRARIVGITATPVGMSHLYPKLVVAGKPSDCLRCGAHVRAVIKAPFEFDLRKVKRVKTGEYSLGDIRKHVWSQQIVGRVVTSWQEENPNARPTLVFAPGVEESIGLMNDFNAAGFKACHIDANKVCVDGAQYTDTDGSIREDVLGRWRAGEIKIICNRYVLREGIDLPQMYHLVLATPFSSIKTYIQSTGRVIRYSPDTPDHVLITDHAGSYYKFGGGPNRDRNWDEMYWQDEATIEKKIREQAAEKPEQDPIVCPHCNTVRHHSIPSCPAPPIGCGRESSRRGKIVVQQNGELRRVSGPNVKAPKVCETPMDQKRWDRLFYAARNSRSGNRAPTFNQIKGLFRRQYGYWPSNNLLRMPIDEATWNRKVRDTESGALRNNTNV